MEILYGLPVPALSAAVALLLGIAAFCNVIVVRRTSALRAVFLWQLLGIPLLMLGLPFFLQAVSLPAIGQIALNGIFIALLLVLSMRALEMEKSAIIYPIFQTTVIVTFFLGVFFFHEVLTLPRIAALILVVIGILALSVTQSRGQAVGVPRFSKGALLALGVALSQGFYFFFVASQVRAIGWYPVTFIIRIVAALAVLGVLLMRPAERAKLFSGVPWGAVLVAAGADVLGFSLYNIAISQADLSYVHVMASSGAIVAAVLGVLFLRERLTVLQIAGIAVTMLGVFILQL